MVVQYNMSLVLCCQTRVTAVFYVTDKLYVKSPAGLLHANNQCCYFNDYSH